MIPSIQKHHMIERHYLFAIHLGTMWTEDLVDGRIGVRSERADTAWQIREGDTHPGITIQESWGAESRILARKQHLLLTH